MAVAIFTILLTGFILGGSTVYLVENHFRTKEMNKIYKLTESLINDNDLDDSDIGKETLYSKTANQLIRLQEMLEGRRKEAEKSQYEIQKLISEIAHQLRTPLSNIKNYTELLQESLDETQEVLNTGYMKDLRTSEEQLCFLVESFIKTARLEQGIIQVHTQKENLVETIINALGQIQKKAEDKGIFFRVELPEKIICEHDKNWMCEAFYNVFDNAVKYSKSNSTIDITMKQTEMFYKKVTSKNLFLIIICYIQLLVACYNKQCCNKNACAQEFLSRYLLLQYHAGAYHHHNNRQIKNITCIAAGH